MRLFIIISFLVHTLCAFSQAPADSLLYYESVYYRSADENLKNELLLKKMNLYLHRGYTGPEVFTEIKRIRVQMLMPESQKDFLWNGALISYLNNETNYADFLLDGYERISGDSSAQFLLLSYLVNKERDTTHAGENLRRLTSIDPIFGGLSCFAKTYSYEKKHRKLFLISSAIVPGSGTIMAGYPLKGLLSLALVGGSVVGTIELIKYGAYFNAFFWGTGVGLKFYTGNLHLTEKMFERSEQKKKNKLAKNCELELTSILKKYPLLIAAQ